MEEEPVPADEQRSRRKLTGVAAALIVLGLGLLLAGISVVMIGLDRFLEMMFDSPAFQ